MLAAGECCEEIRFEKDPRLEAPADGAVKYAYRLEGYGYQRHQRRAERDPGGCVGFVPEDQEFPLAHERAALPGLSSAVRRTGGPDLRDVRSHCGARAQGGRYHATVHRAHIPFA